MSSVLGACCVGADVVACYPRAIVQVAPNGIPAHIYTLVMITTKHPDLILIYVQNNKY